MTSYKKRITEGQAQTIISAYDNGMCIEWTTLDMGWVFYKMKKSIISISTTPTNATYTEKNKIVTFNVKTIELHRKFLFIETDGPIFLFPIGDTSWPPVDKEKLLDGVES